MLASDRNLILRVTHRMMSAETLDITPRTFQSVLWAINTLMRGEKVPEVVERARVALSDVVDA